jgi:hypothetical protein
MNKRIGAVLSGLLLIVALGSTVSAQSAPYEVVNGGKSIYYGHVSYIENIPNSKDVYVLRDEGTRRIPATLNMPLMPGDTIGTPEGRRMEIQFDNGTIIRLDAATELKIETILAESLTTKNKMTNLVLLRGQVYAMFKEYNSREVFQFVMPLAAVHLRHNTVAMLGLGADRASDVQVRYGKATVLYGPDAKALKEQAVYKGERITIGPDHRYAIQGFQPETPFETWNLSINDNFEALHEGQSMLPKPIRRFPLAVQYFAEKYGDRYGEWIYDSYLGYVWRPFYNDSYPGGSWQPYSYGQWTTAGNQMFWVPGEPWGWAPYHLGVWHWNAKRGWLWIPGSAFAPAWVDWAFFRGVFAWRPYSLWDWMYYGDSDYFNGYSSNFNNPFQYLWYMTRYQTAGQVKNPGSELIIDVNDPTHPAAGSQLNPTVLTQVSKKQLAQPGRSPYDMPREFKAAVKALRAGLEKRDPDVLASLKENGKAGQVVSQDRLTSPRIHENTIPLMRFLTETTSGKEVIRTFPTPTAVSMDAAREALRTAKAFNNRDAGGIVNRDDSGSQIRNRTMSPMITRMLPAAATRIRDWNPDVRAAIERGVSIRYDSRANQIYSPELQLRSGDRWSPNSGRSAGGYGSPASSGGSSAASSGSSGSSSSGSTGSSTVSGSGSSGSGRIK